MNSPSSLPVTTGDIALERHGFSLLNTAGPDTFYKVYILSDGIDAGNRSKLEELAAPFDCRLEFIEISISWRSTIFPILNRGPYPPGDAYLSRSC